jgi:hypothetical protein
MTNIISYLQMQPLFTTIHPPKLHPLNPFLLSFSSSNKFEITDLSPEAHSNSFISFSLLDHINSSLSLSNQNQSNLALETNEQSVQSKIWFEWIHNPCRLGQLKTVNDNSLTYDPVQEVKYEGEILSELESFGFIVNISHIKSLFVFLKEKDTIQCQRISYSEYTFFDFKEFQYVYLKHNQTGQIGMLNLNTFVFAMKPSLSQVVDIISTREDCLFVSNNIFDLGNIQIFETKGLIIQVNPKSILIWSIDNGLILKNLHFNSEIQCFDFYVTMVNDNDEGKF